jgi:hypothetical protein
MNELCYIVVTWPDIQTIMEMPGFDTHSYLINDEKGYSEFGSSAYFVEKQWANWAFKNAKF